MTDEMREEKRKQLQKYFTLLHVLGADDAKLIDPQSIVTAPWPRFRCQFGCGSYGKSFCCPPHTPDGETTQKIIDCYDTAILFQFRRMGNLTEVARKAARQLFLDGYYKVIGMGSGPCRICPVCTLANPPVSGSGPSCRFPEEAIPAMEACGIDVFATARSNGFAIETLCEQDEPKHFYGLLLIE